MIQFIRTYLLNAYSALPLLACLLLAGWSSQANSMPAKAAHPYSGEAMFRGIFFAEGNFAQVLPEVQMQQVAHDTKQLTTEQRKQISQVRQQIIDQILSTDQTFFDKFAVALNSHNPVKVNAMLTYAEQKISQTALMKGTERKVSPADRNVCVVATVLVACNFVVVTEVGAVLAIVIVAAQMAHNEKTQLWHEQLTASICKMA